MTRDEWLARFRAMGMAESRAQEAATVSVRGYGCIPPRGSAEMSVGDTLRVIDLALTRAHHKAGTAFHFRHGWIPVDGEAPKSKSKPKPGIKERAAKAWLGDDYWWMHDTAHAPSVREHEKAQAPPPRKPTGKAGAHRASPARSLGGGDPHRLGSADMSREAFAKQYRAQLDAELPKKGEKVGAVRTKKGTFWAKAASTLALTAALSGAAGGAAGESGGYPGVPDFYGGTSVASMKGHHDDAAPPPSTYHRTVSSFSATAAVRTINLARDYSRRTRRSTGMTTVQTDDPVGLAHHVTGTPHRYTHGWKPINADLLGSLKAHGGFTYDPNTGHEVKIGDIKGYAIGIPHTEHELARGNASREEFTSKLRGLLDDESDHLTAGTMIGGWYSEDRDVYLVELSRVHNIPRDQAIARGTAEHQEAILDMFTGEMIDTGGHGDA